MIASSRKTELERAELEKSLRLINPQSGNNIQDSISVNDGKTIEFILRYLNLHLSKITIRRTEPAKISPTDYEKRSFR